MPAAGRATRLGALDGSKEMLPVQGGVPACRPLLTAFRQAGLQQVVAVLRPEKQDLRAYLDADPVAGLEVHQVLVPGGTASVPETLDRAYPQLRDRSVVLGFPDCLFDPPDACELLLLELSRGAADVVLGLFPAPCPANTDMVRYEAEGPGRGGPVVEIESRPPQSTLKLNWLLAAWGPAFTEFLHEEVQQAKNTPSEAELQLGVLFQRALQAGLWIFGAPFPEGRYQDIGTPEGYARVRPK